MGQITSFSLDLFLCGGLCIAQEFVNSYLYDVFLIVSIGWSWGTKNATKFQRACFRKNISVSRHFTKHVTQTHFNISDTTPYKRTRHKTQSFWKIPLQKGQQLKNQDIKKTLKFQISRHFRKKHEHFRNWYTKHIDKNTTSTKHIKENSISESTFQ